MLLLENCMSTPSAVMGSSPVPSIIVSRLSSSTIRGSPFHTCHAYHACHGSASLLSHLPQLSALPPISSLPATLALLTPVFVTGNANKLKEVKAILAKGDSGIECTSQAVDGEIFLPPLQ